MGGEAIESWEAQNKITQAKVEGERETFCYKPQRTVEVLRMYNVFFLILILKLELRKLPKSMVFKSDPTIKSCFSVESVLLCCSYKVIKIVFKNRNLSD